MQHSVLARPQFLLVEELALLGIQCSMSLHELTRHCLKCLDLRHQVPSSRRAVFVKGKKPVAPNRQARSTRRAAPRRRNIDETLPRPRPAPLVDADDARPVHNGGRFHLVGARFARAVRPAEDEATREGADYQDGCSGAHGGAEGDGPDRAVASLNWGTEKHSGNDNDKGTESVGMRRHEGDGGRGQRPERVERRIVGACRCLANPFFVPGSAREHCYQT